MLLLLLQILEFLVRYNFSVSMVSRVDFLRYIYYRGDFPVRKNARAYAAIPLYSLIVFRKKSVPALTFARCDLQAPVVYQANFPFPRSNFLYGCPRPIRLRYLSPSIETAQDYYQTFVEFLLWLIHSTLPNLRKKFLTSCLVEIFYKPLTSNIAPFVIGLILRPMEDSMPFTITIYNSKRQ